MILPAHPAPQQSEKRKCLPKKEPSICIQSEWERESLSVSHDIRLVCPQPVPGNAGIWPNECHQFRERSVTVFHWEKGENVSPQPLEPVPSVLQNREKHKEQSSLLSFIGNLVMFLKRKSQTPLGYSERNLKVLLLLFFVVIFFWDPLTSSWTLFTSCATVPALQRLSPFASWTPSSCLLTENLIGPVQRWERCVMDVCFLVLTSQALCFKEWKQEPT